jgi:hypothetical protein
VGQTLRLHAYEGVEMSSERLDRFSQNLDEPAPIIVICALFAVAGLVTFGLCLFVRSMQPSVEPRPNEGVEIFAQTGEHQLGDVLGNDPALSEDADAYRVAETE